MTATATPPAPPSRKYYVTVSIPGWKGDYVLYATSASAAHAAVKNLLEEQGHRSPILAVSLAPIED